MVTQEQIDMILGAVRATEENADHSNNGLIEEVTGLDSETVAQGVHQLWRDGRIEGVRTLATPGPHLRKIRSIGPDRPPIYGQDGQYRPQKPPDAPLRGSPVKR